MNWKIGESNSRILQARNPPIVRVQPHAEQAVEPLWWRRSRPEGISWSAPLRRAVLMTPKTERSDAFRAGLPRCHLGRIELLRGRRQSIASMLRTCRTGAVIGRAASEVRFSALRRCSGRREPVEGRRADRRAERDARRPRAAGPPEGGHYSERKASIGSTRTARSAGIVVAMSAIVPRAIATPKKVSGSRSLTWKSSGFK